MSMSRKHYVFLAVELNKLAKKVKKTKLEQDFDNLVVSLSNNLKTDNSNFNRFRFSEAVYKDCDK